MNICLMKLIVLAGKDHCGKTESLNMLAGKIKNETGIDPVKIQKGNPASNDWEYIFSENTIREKVNLVVSTWGDYPLLLRECCEKYRDYDAVVCACNLKFMRGKVYKPFEDAMECDPYATVVMKAEEPDASRHEIANEECENYLFSLIKNFGIF